MQYNTDVLTTPATPRRARFQLSSGRAPDKFVVSRASVTSSSVSCDVRPGDAPGEATAAALATIPASPSALTAARATSSVTAVLLVSRGLYQKRPSSCGAPSAPDLLTVICGSARPLSAGFASSTCLNTSHAVLRS